MEALASVTYRHKPVPLSLHHHRPSLSKPFSSLSFKSSSLSSPPSITASISQKPKPHLSKTPPPPPPLLSLLKSTFVAAVTASALFSSRFNLRPAIAAPISPPPTVESETSATDAVSVEEKEKNLEEYLTSNPDDVQALRSLMELKIENRKIPEAIAILEQLIKIEPDDVEWPLLKAHMHSYGGDNESAKLGFNEILSKEPLRVEAYHGLVMAASQTDSPAELKEVEKRIVEGMENCRKIKKKEDVRDFKLLLAQIRVIEGDYNDALKIYDELVKEEPRDFRPYLCQGIIYTLLRKSDDAEKSFQKYRRLVPKGHPYARYFDDNMLATRLFAQKVENERVYSKS